MANPTRVAVIGAGPGGYAAAFHAADLGMQVTLIDVEANPGGVCTFKGCIPSKALLHAAKVIDEAKHAEAFGVSFTRPSLDVNKLRAWKDAVVKRQTGGLGLLAKARKVAYIQGRASIVSPNTFAPASKKSKYPPSAFSIHLFHVLGVRVRRYAHPPIHACVPQAGAQGSLGSTTFPNVAMLKRFGSAFMCRSTLFSNVTFNFGFFGSMFPSRSINVPRKIGCHNLGIGFKICQDISMRKCRVCKKKKKIAAFPFVYRGRHRSTRCKFCFNKRIRFPVFPKCLDLDGPGVGSQYTSSVAIFCPISSTSMK